MIFEWRVDHFNEFSLPIIKSGWEQFKCSVSTKILIHLRSKNLEKSLIIFFLKLYFQEFIMIGESEIIVC